MTLSSRIEAYILKRSGTTLSQLENLATKRGFSLDEVYSALDTIHRNKKIRRTVQKGDVVYSPAPEPKAPGSHLTYVRHNYPVRDETNDGSGIEADYSYLFLTPEELEKYKAEARGVQYIPSKRYAKKKREGIRHTT